MRLQLMTFNIRNGKAHDGENSWIHRKDFACDIISESKSDVLGVQEAFRFQLDDMALLLPEYAELGIGRGGGIEDEYAAILYLKERFNVDDSGTFWLSETPDTPSMGWGAKHKRICTWARLVEKSSGEAFYVYNTHLDHRVREAQINGIKLLMKRISQRAHADPIILMGDFNVYENDQAIKYIKDYTLEYGKSISLLVDTFRVIHPDIRDFCTWHGFGEEMGGGKIDYIFAPRETQVFEAKAIKTQRQGRFPSDHYPLTAKLRIQH